MSARIDARRLTARPPSGHVVAPAGLLSIPFHGVPIIGESLKRLSQKDPKARIAMEVGDPGLLFYAVLLPQFVIAVYQSTVMPA
jgi:hypothetical protein